MTKINLTEYLDDTLKFFPEKTAIIDEGKRYSFGQLEARSKSLACTLIAKLGAAINSPVGVFLPKSADCIFCDIAVLYSGNIYMNLDVKSPLPRIKNIIDLIKPKLVFSSGQYAKSLKEIAPELDVIDVDDFLPADTYDSELICAQISRLIDTDPMCIINTSGSTGTPKGVVLNHRSFIDFTEWADDTFHFDTQEIIGSLSPAVFDIYSYELCLLMSKASTFVLIPDNFSLFPIKILNLLNEISVTFLFWVPSIMVNIANMQLLPHVDLSSLKMIWFAGEVFPTAQFNYWKRNIPYAKFVNLYGPIEITLDCTYYVVTRELADDEPIPIGHACRNTDIIILNDDDKKSAIGEEGELCVRGTPLAMGYYNAPEKTAAVFVQNPLNASYPELIYRTGDIAYQNEIGEIIFKGRKDSLIKHMGYRIELSEIEHVLVNTLKLVDNACVVYEKEGKRIVLFYEAKNNASEIELRKAIATQLPKYMVPTVYIKLSELPRNANGKIDRLALANFNYAMEKK